MAYDGVTPLNLPDFLPAIFADQPDSTVAVYDADSEYGYADVGPTDDIESIVAGWSSPTASSGGMPAVLHPNEAVIPLSRGRKVPVEMSGGQGGGTVVQNFTWNVTTPDADSFRKSQSQIAADAARQGRHATAKND